MSVWGKKPLPEEFLSKEFLSNTKILEILIIIFTDGLNFKSHLNDKIKRIDFKNIEALRMKRV
jgi:hypothetical protein